MEREGEEKKKKNPLCGQYFSSLCVWLAALVEIPVRLLAILHPLPLPFPSTLSQQTHTRRCARLGPRHPEPASWLAAGDAFLHCHTLHP